MENNNQGDYGQQTHTPQDKDNGSTPVTNNANSNTNPGRAEETSGDAYSAGFNSDTNPDRSDSVTNGSGKSSSENPKGNSDFGYGKDSEQHSELIPDSDAIEEDEYEDREDEEIDEQNRTPGL